MKIQRTLVKAVACFGLGAALTANAQTIKTWTGGNGNFFDPSHWDTASIPDGTDIAVIDNGSTATILAADGTKTFGAIRLGPTQDSTESGHVIMNGAILNLGGAPRVILKP